MGAPLLLEDLLYMSHACFELYDADRVADCAPTAHNRVFFLKSIRALLIPAANDGSGFGFDSQTD